MTHLSRFELPVNDPVSPLTISDRLLTLAQQADRCGYRAAARRLLDLAMTVLDEAPLQLSA